MFNLNRQANLVISGLSFLFGCAALLSVLYIWVVSGNAAGGFKLIFVQVFTACVVLFGSALILLTAYQDAACGESSYNAKGALIKSDGINETYQIIMKTVLRDTTPYRFWGLVLLKVFMGLLPLVALPWGLAALAGN
ncbi:hypothetical protein [uncultured Rubinisphaera sp.]|uniref:hypothetical protein n=1 Tax=uncultured Rubinisphaera sp. TaxID=1678686 RepID=UPI0030DDCB9F